jgi:3-polyprenyl-4-hydroxybenzoate decarboxylase
MSDAVVIAAMAAYYHAPLQVENIDSEMVCVKVGAAGLAIAGMALNRQFPRRIAVVPGGES